MNKPYIKYIKALTNLGLAIVLLLCVIFLLPKVLTFFAPFLIGWIIALIASPLVHFFEVKLKLKRKAGSAFVIVVVIALVVLLLYLLISKLITEGIELVNALPLMWKSLETDFVNISANLSVVYERLPFDFQDFFDNIGAQASSYIGDFLSKISEPTIAAVGNFAKQLPTVIIGTIMCLLSSYLFVSERNQISKWMAQHIPNSIQQNYKLIRKSVVTAVGGYFKAQFKIEFWIYLLLLLGLSILKVKFAFVIAFGIALLDLLPFFGAGTVMVPWAIIKILSTDYQFALGLLIIWGITQLVRQIIQPKIVGDSIGVAPIPTLFFLYIGYMVGGVIGMIIAIPIGMILMSLNKEGVFDTTKNSLLILIYGLNHFRSIEKEDMAIVEMKRQESENLEKVRDKNKNGQK